MPSRRRYSATARLGGLASSADSETFRWMRASAPPEMSRSEYWPRRTRLPARPAPACGASTAVFSLAQLAKPYSRATASCAAASVVETEAIRAAVALSRDRAARSKSLAWRRRCPRSGRAGRVAMTSPSPARGPRTGPIRSHHDLPSVKPEVDYVLPADPAAPSSAHGRHDTVRDHAVVVARRTNTA